MGDVKDALKDEYKAKITDSANDMIRILKKIDPDNIPGIQKMTVSLQEHLDIITNFANVIRGLG